MIPNEFNFETNGKPLSDHAPQVFQTSGFGQVMTWNVLMQCDYYVTNEGEYFNNGFKVKETKQEYFERVDRIVDFIENQLNSNDINIVCLQEFPKLTWDGESGRYFVNALNERLYTVGNYHYSLTYSNDSDSIIIYNDSVLELVSDGHEHEAILNKELSKNAHRFDSAVFANEDGETLNVVSVHLKGFDPNNMAEEFKSVLETQKIIDFTEHTADHFFITGDFNYDVKKYEDYFAEYSDSTIAIERDPASTLTSVHGPSDEAWLNTCDGAIFDYALMA